MRPVWSRLALVHSYAVGQRDLAMALVGLVRSGQEWQTFNSLGCISFHFDPFLSAYAGQSAKFPACAGTTYANNIAIGGAMA